MSILRKPVPILGLGPEHRSTVIKADAKHARAVGKLPAGAPVDVLLDDGRIIRGTWQVSDRGIAWIEEIRGSYALNRVRKPDGWKGEPGVAYFEAPTAPGEDP